MVRLHLTLSGMPWLVGVAASLGAAAVDAGLALVAGLDLVLLLAQPLHVRVMIGAARGKRSPMVDFVTGTCAAVPTGRGARIGLLEFRLGRRAALACFGRADAQGNSHNGGERKAQDARWPKTCRTRSTCCFHGVQPAKSYTTQMLNGHPRKCLTGHADRLTECATTRCLNIGPMTAHRSIEGISGDLHHWQHWPSSRSRPSGRF